MPEVAEPVVIKEPSGPTDPNFLKVAEKYKSKEVPVEQTPVVEAKIEPVVEPVKKVEKKVKEEVKPKVEEKKTQVVGDEGIKVEKKVEEETIVDDNVLTPEEEAFNRTYSPKKEEPKEVVLGDEKAPAKQVEKTPDQTIKNLSDEVQGKVKAYDAISAHPIFEPLISFVQSGGTDIIDFVRQLDIVDSSRMEIADFIRMDAMELGLKGQDLEDAVEEDMNKWTSESTTKTEKMRKLASLKKDFDSRQNDKLKKFTVQHSQEAEREEQLSRTSHQNLTARVNDIVTQSKLWKESDGKKGELYMGGLLIDEPMAQAILEIAAPASYRLLDDHGKLSGHNLDVGIAGAIEHLYGSRLRENLVKTAKAVAIKEYLRERHRPTESSQPAAAIPSTEFSTKANMSAYKTQTQGI